MKEIEISLDDEIKDTEWRWAKTYAEIAPHWYIRMYDNPLLYGLLMKYIEKYGEDENYTNHKGTTYLCRYFYYNEYKYWHMSPVLNRALIKQGETDGNN